MTGRHIQTLIAVMLAAIWGYGIYFEHSRGGLRFLDRIESATIDIRTLARGKRSPPDLVTIVAIDDDVVKLRGLYPLPRADLARVVEAIAQLEPKVLAVDLLLVDNGAADADEALAKSLSTRPAVVAAVEPQSGQGRDGEHAGAAAAACAAGRDREAPGC